MHTADLFLRLQAAPAGKCLAAKHNASLFGPVTVCAGERSGNCRTQPGGTPVRADLVLYITSASGGVASCGAAVASSSSAGTAGASALLAAAGGACETDTKSGRPVAGAINLCPGRVAALSSADAWSADALVTDFLHELMHVLAFSEGLYRFFPSEGAGIASAPDGGLLVSSPAVLGVARQHFACTTLRGVPLETEGGSGTARTHWRLRALNGELMTGTVLTGQRPRLSNFTLAFLQDTGWYVVNYSAAERLTWGAGAGCAFVTAASCAELAGSGFFCLPRAGAVSCTSDHQAVGSCSPLPLTRPDEKCFSIIPYSNWLCRDAALQSADRSMWGYNFGAGARCIAAGATPWSRTDGPVVYTQESAVPGCFATRCNASGALFVSIDDVKISCPQGQRIELSSVKGAEGLRRRSASRARRSPSLRHFPRTRFSACLQDCAFEAVSLVPAPRLRMHAPHARVTAAELATAATAPAAAGLASRTRTAPPLPHDDASSKLRSPRCQETGLLVR